jgi:ADP-heptose:LPS heptosyltransferase
MKFLIDSGSGIGDMIQFLSMARAIKEQMPNTTVDLIMRGSKQVMETNQQIINCQNYVDNLYWYSSKSILHDIGLVIKLWKKKYDVGFVRVELVSGTKSLWIYFIMRIIGCIKIIGTGTNKVDTIVHIPPGTHYLKRNSLLLEAAGICGRNNALSINKEALDSTWLNSLNIRKESVVVGLSLGTNSFLWKEKTKALVYDVKSWSYENWFNLAETLSEKGIIVILIGGAKERNDIEELGLSFPNKTNILDFVNKTTICQSLTLLNRCNLVIGSEGGMMHCASALGVKVLTIFGGSDYKIFNPGGENSPIVSLNLDCSPCIHSSAGAHCTNRKCLNDISVNMVVDAAVNLL